MPGSSGIKPIILVCVCVCACVANTGASRPLPGAIAGQRNIRQSKQSGFFSRFSTWLTRWIWRCFILCVFVLNWLQNLCCKSVSSCSCQPYNVSLSNQTFHVPNLRNTTFCLHAPRCSTSFWSRLKRTMSKNELTMPANLACRETCRRTAAPTAEAPRSCQRARSSCG